MSKRMLEDLKIKIILFAIDTSRMSNQVCAIFAYEFVKNKKLKIFIQIKSLIIFIHLKLGIKQAPQTKKKIFCKQTAHFKQKKHL